MRIVMLRLAGSKTYDFALGERSDYGVVLDIMNLSDVGLKEIRVVVRRDCGDMETIVFSSENPLIILHMRKEVSDEE